MLRLCKNVHLVMSLAPFHSKSPKSTKMDAIHNTHKWMFFEKG